MVRSRGGKQEETHSSISTYTYILRTYVCTCVHHPTPDTAVLHEAMNCIQWKLKSVDMNHGCSYVCPVHYVHPCPAWHGNHSHHHYQLSQSSINDWIPRGQTDMDMGMDNDPYAYPTARRNLAQKRRKEKERGREIKKEKQTFSTCSA